MAQERVHFGNWLEVALAKKLGTAVRSEIAGRVDISDRTLRKAYAMAEPAGLAGETVRAICQTLAMDSAALISRWKDEPVAAPVRDLRQTAEVSRLTAQEIADLRELLPILKRLALSTIPQQELSPLTENVSAGSRAPLLPPGSKPAAEDKPGRHKRS